MRRFVYPSVLVLIWSIGVAGVLFWALKKCDGHLMYALDDPYIHLAVGETILKGGYGVDITEHSAPSSSIVFPYLMAAGTALGGGVWVPFLANLLPMAVAVWVLGLLLQDHVLGRGADGRWSAGTWLAGLALGGSVCLLMNAWGLLFLGMEHALHVMLVVLSLLACIRVAAGQKWPTWMLLVLAALPMVRFEALAMSVVLLCLFAMSRQWRLMLLGSAMLVTVMGGWFAYMQSLGLPWLPSSVLMKSSTASTLYDSGLGGRMLAVFDNFWANLTSRQGGVLGILTVLIFLGAWLKRVAGQDMAARIALASGVVCASQEVLGRFGWFSRYEVYAMTLAIVTLLWLWKDRLQAWPGMLAVAAVIFIAATPYLMDTIRTPAATRNVYQQQYQMHRFATEFHRGPVAVNDLGWVSYRNDMGVLDLFGLGSEEVRGLKKLGRYDAQAIERLMDKHGMGVAMVYDDWLPSPLPTSWVKVAVLKTSKVSSYGDQVSFFVSRSAVLDEVMSALCRLKPTLPKGAQLMSPSVTEELACP